MAFGAEKAALFSTQAHGPQSTQWRGGRNEKLAGITAADSGTTVAKKTEPLDKPHGLDMAPAVETPVNPGARFGYNTNAKRLIKPTPAIAVVAMISVSRLDFWRLTSRLIRVICNTSAHRYCTPRASSPVTSSVDFMRSSRPDQRGATVQGHVAAVPLSHAPPRPPVASLMVRYGGDSGCALNDSYRVSRMTPKQ